MNKSSTQSKTLFSHSEADLCVACGLCLPHCPTYRLTQSENESPRGRLSLIRGLATGQIPADAGLVSHLEKCTLCLACEKACPAGVEFGVQMSRARGWLNGQGLSKRSLIETFLLSTLKNGDARIRQFGYAARMYQRNPIRKFLRGSGLLKATGFDKADRELPEFSKKTEFESSYPAVEPKKGEIGLFTGCLQDQTDPETLPAVITVLNAGGYSVIVPQDQVCCGGLHLHSGDTPEAQKLARENTHAFAGIDQIVSVASGCGAVLEKYGQLLESESGAITGKFQDIGALIIEKEILSQISFSALAATALIHEPCSHRNQLKQSQSTYALLQAVPELKLSPLPGNDICCGGAGTYGLSQPDLANKMREPKLEALAKLKPDYLVTTNIGCALHLKAGLSKYDIDVEIVHPVVLLARQLQQHNLKTQRTCADPTTANMV